jgi:formate dehydrogenase
LPPDADIYTSASQARYDAGTLEILGSYFSGTPIRGVYLILDGEALAGTGTRSYKLTSFIASF